MANKESTAINALIDLVQVKPLDGDVGPSDDLFGSKPAPVPAAVPASAPVAQPSAAPAPKVRMMTAPSRIDTIPPLTGAKRTTTMPPPPGSRAAGTPSPTLLPPSARTTTVPPPRSVVQPPAAPAPAMPAPAPVQAVQPQPLPVAAKPVLPPPASKPVPQPQPMPSSRPVEAKPLRAKAASGNPFDATPELGSRPSKLDMTGDVVSADQWFEPSRAVEKFEEETFVGTAPVVRLERRRKMVVLKIAATSVVFVMIGVAVGAYIAFRSDQKPAQAATMPKPPSPAVVAQPTVVQPIAPTTDSTAPATAAAQPAPAPVQAAPDVAPAPTAPIAPATKLADVRIDSKPSGATVMLVDNGKTSFLGTTPLATSLDPSHPYDLVMTLEGHPTKMAHIDPAKSARFEVALDGSAPATPAPAPMPAPAHEHVDHGDRVATPSHAAHASHASSSSSSIGQISDPFGGGGDSSAPAGGGGDGTLMVSTKPPCELVIDGKVTGMHTPQRAIPLSAGAHTITFINAGEHIHKTVSVSVAADKTTKLVKDLLDN